MIDLMPETLVKESLVLHEDIFHEFFLPYRHPKTQSNIWGGHGLETFGPDFQLVRNFDEAYIWTVIDGCESQNQWITPGICYVNRVCYLVTVKPHNWLEVEFLIPHRARSLTPLGLARQMKMLEKAIFSHFWVGNPPIFNWGQK